MKKLKLKSGVKSTLAILSFYLIIVVGVIALNSRFEYLNQQKSADSISYRESAQMPR